MTKPPSSHFRRSPGTPEPAVYVVQHVECEPPDLIGEALDERGLAVDSVRPFHGERILRGFGEHAGGIVMGGPMGVHETSEYPFLRQEIRLLEDALHLGRLILGVCLGSQLLASALGAPVPRGWRKKIGWHGVTLSRNDAQDSQGHGLPEAFVAYHWRGDFFDLPFGATALAWSAFTDYQAFRYGQSAYGLVFHLDATERIIRAMMCAFRRELLEAGASAQGILNERPTWLPPLQVLGRKVFARLAALLPGEMRKPGGRTRPDEEDEVKEYASAPCHLHQQYPFEHSPPLP